MGRKVDRHAMLVVAAAGPGRYVDVGIAGQV